MKTRFLAFALILAAVPAAAGAQGAASSLQTFITEHDQDGDGVVTRSEFEAARKQRFALADVDKDGALSQTEYVQEFAARLERQLAALPPAERAAERAAQLQQAPLRFRVLDANGDGLLQPAEYAASGATFFGMHDLDGNGSVSADDARARAKPAPPGERT